MSKFTHTRLFIAALLIAAGLAWLAVAPALADTPTCSDVLAIDNHGQHIVGDYVTGIGHEDLGWPPAGQVGDATGGEGVALAGGPGPGFHFPNGFAPGASFCISQSQAPGFHVP